MERGEGGMFWWSSRGGTSWEYIGGGDLAEIERRNESNNWAAWAFPWGVVGERYFRERRGGTWVCGEDQLSLTGGVRSERYRRGSIDGRVGLTGVEER